MNFPKGPGCRFHWPDEAEQYDRWEKSGESGVEVSLGLCLMMSLALFTVKQPLSHYFCLLLDTQINLPPLIENEKGRKQVASTLERSRANFRKFRDSLSQDIGSSKGRYYIVWDPISI